VADDLDPSSIDLDGPADNDAIYLSVGEVVEDVRPINQGDVFRGITLPGFEEGHHDMVMLTTHPCSLRAGPKLKPRMQAAPLIRSKAVVPGQWTSQHKRSMPLPGVLGDGKFYTATLTETSIVTPEQLSTAERIAALSDDGLHLLQQRIVWACTHTVMKLDTIADYSAPVLAEIELLEEWNIGLGAHYEEDRPTRLATVASDFEEFIKTSGVQADLQLSRKRGDARRRAREELQRRLDAEDGENKRQPA
jgi:hypothetical protein